jgi:hypothetical protein
MDRFRRGIHGQREGRRRIRRPRRAATRSQARQEVAAMDEAIPVGVRPTVTARNAAVARAVTRVRRLGFIGLLTLGVQHERALPGDGAREAMPGPSSRALADAREPKSTATSGHPNGASRTIRG